MTMRVNQLLVAALLLGSTLGLGVFGPGACGPALKEPTEQDWATRFPGKGAVPTRVVNESDRPLTVRIKDYTGLILAQVALEPRSSQTIYLRSGPVQAIVRAERSGEMVESKSQEYNVPAETIGVEWRFFPPP
jgi:hypothetical protein